MDIIPSHLKGFDRGDLGGNLALRIGEVKERILPGDERNNNKKFDEYSVFVQHLENDAYSPKMYYHCTLLSDFGGLADKTHFSLRNDPGTKRIGNGSKVLILCINGSYKNAIIIGGIRDSQEESKDDQDLFADHHYYWLFNGVEIFVNKDGEYSITYNGKTDDDGERNQDVSEDVIGSQIALLKDGTIQGIAKNKVILKHKEGVHIGAATDKTMMGSTYRDAEHSMNQDLQTGLTNIAIKLGLIGGFLQTAGAAMVVPVTGAVAAAAPITAASQALVQVVQDIQKMVQSIAQFEANAEKYLSSKNLSD